MAYVEECFSELEADGRRQTGNTTTRSTLTAAERTARGLVRVDLVGDGVQIGSFFIDPQGRIQDAVPTQQARADDDRIVRGIFSSALELVKVREEMWFERDLKVEERPSVEMSFRKTLEQSGLTVFGDNPVRLRGFVQYMGLKRIGPARTASVRTEMSADDTPINVQAKGASALVRLNELRVDATEYFDPARGYLVASYQILTMGIVSGRQSGVMRFSCHKTLDLTDSRGIDSRKSGLVPAT